MPAEPIWGISDQKMASLKEVDPTRTAIVLPLERGKK
jgi:hypothetical protein